MHSVSTRRALTRLAATSASALLLAAAATGCGSEKDSKTDEPKDTAPKVNVLSEPEATTALLTAGNLGGTFAVNPNADHSTKSPGCLSALDPLTDDTEAPTNAVRDFTTSSEESLSVGSQVQSYDSVKDAEKVIETFRTAMADCTGVDETDAGGITYKLDVKSDDEKADDVDDQVNVLGYGTGADASGPVPFGFQLSVARVGNDITLITVAAQTEEPPGDIKQLVDIVVDRLNAVIDGDQPDDSVVAGG